MGPSRALPAPWSGPGGGAPCAWLSLRLHWELLSASMCTHMHPCTYSTHTARENMHVCGTCVHTCGRCECVRTCLRVCSCVPGVPAQECWLTAPPSPQRCRYDTCNCANSEDCLCAALSSYARACAARGVLLWGWRELVCSECHLLLESWGWVWCPMGVGPRFPHPAPPGAAPPERQGPGEGQPAAAGRHGSAACAGSRG